jgi:hypothetical protein
MEVQWHVEFFGAGHGRKDTQVVLSCDFNEWVFMILAYSGMVVY